MTLTKLPYLIDEICAAVEIYFTGRTGGQYLKTAFVLCDDYTELTAKLFLLTDDRHWSDRKANGLFKSYHDVLADVEAIFQASRPAHADAVKALHRNMKDRRTRRNGFFHSTHLLDLSATRRSVVDAFCDLFDYGALLLGDHWQPQVQSSRNLETMHILLLLDRAAFSDPAILPRLDAILQRWKRTTTTRSGKGIQETAFPEDFHLRLCIRDGGSAFRVALRALLPPGGPSP